MKPNIYYIIQLKENPNLFLQERHSRHEWWVKETAWDFHDIETAAAIAKRLGANLVKVTESFELVN